MNQKKSEILWHMLLSAIALFWNGFGIHLTIRANIGVHPYDVFNMGLSNTFGILFGTASVCVAFSVLFIDILLKEPIGISMFIDAIVVGKAVDFFNWLDIIPVCHTIYASIGMMLLGLTIMGYTQYFYMIAALGCGPRDTLLVGLNKRCKKIPIGVVSIGILSAAAFGGYLMGGSVGIGTLICAFGAGPIMQLAFTTMHFDATTMQHQNLKESWQVFRSAS